MNILVLGLGNFLRGDDAAGLEIVRLWQEKNPTTANKVRIEFTENIGLELIDLLANIQAALIVDAIHTEAPAGTLFRFEINDLDLINKITQSSHGWGISEMLELGSRLNPQFTLIRLIAIGITGQNFDYGAPLSPKVKSSLDAGAEMLRKKCKLNYQLTYTYRKSSWDLVQLSSKW